MNRFGLLATFFGALAVITAREVITLQRVPHPESYAHAALVWVVLGIVSDLGLGELATVFGFGLLISMIYTYYTGKSNPLTPGAGGTGGDVLQVLPPA